MKISKELENRSAIDGGCHCFDAKKTRRDFLSRASRLAIAVLVYEGIRAKDAEAFSLSFVSANPEGAECSFDVPSSDGASVELENQVILVRTANRIYAFALACPHENTALRWRAKDGYFQCPRHQAKYQTDGAYISGRRTRNMDRFSIRSEGAKIIVDLNKLYRSDEQKADWESAFVVV